MHLELGVVRPNLVVVAVQEGFLGLSIQLLSSTEPIAPYRSETKLTNGILFHDSDIGSVCQRDLYPGPIYGDTMNGATHFIGPDFIAIVDLRTPSAPKMRAILGTYK
jgi:hypothetical protein